MEIPEGNLISLHIIKYSCRYPLWLWYDIYVVKHKSGDDRFSL